ncbi:extracellular elastinolytic metalloproteinase [Yasminevirus sp. GU-2018]|uniref:Extracellular elastinolytic metalloproteinase n=1 Tax=Yasminevirus sp. GU-2018 TaxID=2420051 RepID=A0A5K0UBL6_9VIRU|nr:extracellular elastinolytic metalloproteinase [Yasminevirus sp. GU-2018]
MNYAVLKKYLVTTFRWLVIIFALTSCLSFIGWNNQIHSSTPNYSVQHVSRTTSVITKVFSDLSVTPFEAITENFDSIHKKTYPGARKTVNYAGQYNIWHIDSLDGTDNMVLDGNYVSNYTGTGSNIVLVDVFVKETSDLTDRVIGLTDRRSHHMSNDVTLLNHGTLMAGVAGGTTFGVAPNATIYHYQLRTQKATNLPIFDTEDAHILNILSNSVCTKEKRCVLLLPFEFENLNSYTFDITVTLQQLLSEKKYIIVMASGNSNTQLNRTSSHIDNDIIIVGGYTLNGSGKPIKSLSSNYGDRIDVYAPSVDVLAVGVADEMMITGGTSSASAVVAGWVATLLEKQPSLSTKDVLDMIQQMNQASSDGVMIRPLRDLIQNSTIN